MPVVFATDFSPLAREMGRSAAVIAERLREPLELLHVINPGLRDLTDDSPWAWHAFAEAQLDQERSRLEPLPVKVEEQLLEGPPEKVLARHVEEIAARAVLIPSPAPSSTRRSPRSWFTAPRYALGCRAPVLLVRDPAALRSWLQGEKHLRVMVGVDRSAASRSAVRWLADLRRIGPCDVLVESVYWPPEEHERLGVHEPMGLDGRDPVEPILLRDLEELVGELPGEGTTRLQVHGGYGRPAEHLLSHAIAEDVELLVIGSPGAHGRLRHRSSVAHQLVARAPMSIASVCASAPRSPARPEYRTVLVALDSAEGAHAAIAHALATVTPEGKVHLFHVTAKNPWLPTSHAHRREAHDARTREDLLELARPLSPRSIQLSVEALQHRDPAIAISQAAERIGADLICIAEAMTTRLSGRRWRTLSSRVASRTDRAVLVLGPAPSRRAGR